MNTVPDAKRDCPFVGPWVVSRGVLIGQFCQHPDNLDAQGHIRLDSLTCQQWESDCQCPWLKDMLQGEMR